MARVNLPASEPIYAAAERFVEAALRGESSLFTPDVAIGCKKGQGCQVDRAYATDIQGSTRLRALHAELDRAILACYGWEDMKLGRGFHQNDRGQTRYTVSDAARREILARLLKLNLEVAARERGEFGGGD